jgi:hypothetical protein
MPYTVIPDSDERASSSERGGAYTQTLSWKVLVDIPSPTLLSIQAAVGVYVGNAGPSGTVCSNVRVRGSEDRYLYRVTAEYSRLEVSDNPLSESPKFQWVGSISGQRPATMALGHGSSGEYKSSPDGTTYNVPILNSAFDPIEGVMADVVEARLRIVSNKASFSSATARLYVGSVNLQAYGGGNPYTWKCQSIEASEQEAQVDDGTGTGATVSLSYWQVTAELAYIEEGWAVKPWDIGFNEVYTSSGDRRKICVPRLETLPGYTTGNTDDAKAKRNLLITQFAARDQQALYSIDGSIQDQALAGAAKPDGHPPTARVFHLARARSWTGIFPEPPA